MGLERHDGLCVVSDVSSCAVERHRFRSLDGLRGLLALAVVIHHCMLTANPPASFRANPLLWVATYTPLHLFWAGTESVFAFFVLSGFVLVMPWVDGRGITWRSYYPQRLLRLYLPIIGAGILAYTIWLVFPRTPGGGLDAWAAMHAGTYGFTDFLKDLAILRGTSEQLDAPFWSLIWEVVFSLALPVAVLLVRRVPRALSGLVAAGLLYLTWWAQHRWGDAGGVHQLTFAGVVTFLPIFGVGVVMAMNRDLVRRAVLVATATVPSTLLVWAAVLVAFLWRFLRLPSELWPTAPVIGAACLVALFAYSGSGCRLGTARVTAWLGARSFSIYLTHFPIVMTFAFALRSGQPWIVLVTALPVSLAVATLFHRWVERPAHELSRTVGAVLRLRPSEIPA